MSLGLKKVIFLALVVASVGFLAWAMGHDPKETLWDGASAVIFVAVTQWFTSRFSGRRRRTAWIAIYWALGAMVTGAYAFWEFILLRVGYTEQKSLAKAVVAGAIFVVCSSASVWSLVSLRKSATNRQIPT
jgi:MFS family permease